MWVQAVKAVLRKYRSASINDNSRGMEAAIISLLALPAKVLGVRKEVGGRQRERVINAQIGDLLRVMRAGESQGGESPGGSKTVSVRLGREGGQ